MSEYPERILPRSCYCSKITLSDLEGKNLYLQRKCFLPEDQCCVDGDRNNVTPAAFGNSGLYNMSVNLLGGLFIIGDEKWYQYVTEKDNWETGEIDIRLYEGRYQLQDINTSVYFKFDIANNLHWQFPRCFNDQNQFNKYEEAIVKGMSNKSFTKGATYFLKAHSECEHSPNCLNYWHLEVKSVIDSLPPEEIIGNNKNYQKNALRGMIEVLRKNSSLNPPTSIGTISEKIYIKEYTE